MSSACGSWIVVVDGRPHQVIAEWDIGSTGRGSITIDGVVAEQWSFGLKWPGAQRRFAVAGRAFVIAKRGVLDQQLDLYAGEPGLGWPVAPSAPKAWLLVVVIGVVLTVVALVIAVMSTLLAPGRP
jgi:hypothetical protein